MDAAEISRRLKAARWLAGGLDEKGRPAPLSPEALAQREPLRRNRITANRISEFERLVSEAREMELAVIAEALGIPVSFFTVADDRVAAQLRRVEAEVSELRVGLQGLATATLRNTRELEELRETGRREEPGGGDRQ